MFKQQFRKITSLLLSITLLFALPSVTVMAASVSDISAHWAENSILSWVNSGYIKGYPNGTFKPDNQITRAEFVTLINGAFGGGSPSTKSFSDLASSHWAYGNLQQAVGNGYISGYPDGTIKPDANITREEASAIIAQLKGISTGMDTTKNFGDSWKISNWSKGYINAVTQFDIMRGFPDGTFRPQTPLTRAEAVTALSKAKGATSSNINSNVNSNINNVVNNSNNIQNNNAATVNTDYTMANNETSLKNKVINGRLILPSGLNSSNITLENVTVKGETTISGGKKITASNSAFGTVSIDKKDVEFDTGKNSTVSKLIFLRNALIKGSGYTDVVADDKNVSTARIDARVKNLSIDKSVNVKLLADAIITNLNADTKSDGTEVNFTKGAEVSNFDIHDTIEISGRGTIDTMTVYESGVRSSITPERLLRKNGASAPKYTDNTGYDDDDDDNNSKYDNLSIDDDKTYNGKGKKYNNVTIKSDGAHAKDMIIYGNVNIDRAVGDGKVTLEDLDIRGDVNVYGGGDHSVLFENCTIKGDIFSDTSKKDVSSSKQNNPVALKFDSSTKISGAIHIRGNTILDSTGSSSSLTLGNVIIDREHNNGTELEIRVRVDSLEMNRKSKVTLNYKSLGNVTIASGAAGSTLTLNNSAIISSVTANGKVDITGKGIINKLTNSGSNASLGSGVVVDNTQTPGNSVSGVILSPTVLQLKTGETKQLISTVSPATASNKAITYTSSAPSIASVSATGLVSGVKDGSAIITVTTVDGGKTAQCSVGVGSATPPNPDLPGTDDKVTSITLDLETLTLPQGKTQKLVATTVPPGAKVKWRLSSSSTYVSVDSDGTVRALTPTTAGVTVLAEAGSNRMQARCVVKVNGEFSLYPSVLNLKLGGNSSTLEALNVPSETVTWGPPSGDCISTSPGSNDKSISIKPLKTGSATISATAAAKTLTATVTVLDLKLNESNVSLPAGSETKLNATIEPATNTGVSWSVPKNIYVSVSQEGKVVIDPKAPAGFETTITVKSNDLADLKATCKVTVEPAFAIQQTILNLKPGETGIALNALNIPKDETVTWSIESGATATDVAFSGTTTGLAASVDAGNVAGTATISATTNGTPPRKASCTVNVFSLGLKHGNTELTEGNPIILLSGGKKATLTPVITPSSATNATVVYSIADSSKQYLSIDSATGEITTNATSNAFAVPITATLMIAGKELLSTKCTVKVTSALSLDPPRLDINKTTPLTDFTLTLKNNTADSTVRWESDDPNFATVAGTGNTAKVTPVKEGKVIIRAIAGSDKSEQIAECTVNIYGMHLEKDSKTIKDDDVITMLTGESFDVSAITDPGIDQKLNIKWTSDDSSKINVLQTTYSNSIATVKALQATGEKNVAITAKLMLDTKELAECTFTVKATNSFKLNESQLKLKIQDKKTLTADPANSATIISWESNNENCVTVDPNGNLCAKGYGNATITATATDGQKATCLVTVQNLTLSDTTVSLKVGEAKKLTATMNPAGTFIWTDIESNDYVSFKSDDAKKELTITGIAPTNNEKFFVTAKSTEGDELEVKCQIIVTSIPVTSITISPTAAVSINVGDTSQLDAKIMPLTASIKNVVWSSDTPTIATVDNLGLVTGIAIGTANITASAGGQEKTKSITVKKSAVTSVAIENIPSTNLAVEAQHTVSAVVKPDSSIQSVTWSSTDEKVATTSPTVPEKTVPEKTEPEKTEPEKTEPEKTEPVKEPEKAAVEEPKKEPVKTEPEEIAVTSISIETAGTSGKSTVLKAVISPANATNKNVTWKSSDTSVAKVDQKGTLTAVGTGSAVITAISDDGGKTANYDVNIQESKVEIKSISMSKTLQLGIGARFEMHPTIYPQNATKQNLLWESSDTNIATVSSDGTIIALNAGTTTITATSEDGEKSAKTTIIVKDLPLSRISINKARLDMVTGGTYKLSVVTTPLNTGAGSITWSSSAPSLVSVDQVGNIKALGKTTKPVIITAKSSTGKFSTTVINVTK